MSLVIRRVHAIGMDRALRIVVDDRGTCPELRSCQTEYPEWFIELCERVDRVRKASEWRRPGAELVCPDGLQVEADGAVGLISLLVAPLWPGAKGCREAPGRETGLVTDLGDDVCGRGGKIPNTTSSVGTASMAKSLTDEFSVLVVTAETSIMETVRSRDSALCST